MVLCAHGIDGGPGAASAHARALGRRGVFAEVRAACLKGRPSLGDAIAATTAARVHIVPFLMADGYTYRALLRRALAEVARSRRELILHPPVGLNEELAALIAAQAEAVCRACGWRAGDTSVLLVAHGTRRDRGSRAAAQRHARALTHGGRFADVTAAFLDEPPSVTWAMGRLRRRCCVVVGLFADAGPHGRDDVGCIVAAAGETARYAGPIGANPAVAGLILDATVNGTVLTDCMPDA